MVLEMYILDMKPQTIGQLPDISRVAKRIEYLLYV